MPPSLRQALLSGLVIPACPLALDKARMLDERRQRALCRYYAAAGAGGLAVAVHTTQFAIRDPKHGLLEPVLALAADALPSDMVRIGGVCGPAERAIAEAELLARLGYDAGLVSLAALSDARDDALIAHCERVAEVLPIVGFYLQPAVGGRVLSYAFWRRFAEIPNVVAVKIAPFNRYRTLDVVRALAESCREDIALYTGNDDSILIDLLTPVRFILRGRPIERRIVGGLLGHWAVHTRRAVEQLKACQTLTRGASPIPAELLRLAAEVTDMNAALFDAANGFAGCIAGIHEVLRRQGLLAGTWCLDPKEGMSPGQAAEIDRVTRAYPHLTDDAFIAEHRAEWLNG